ncbi:MAG: efflux RND transporter permease subunit, partial [Planctomycetota bacterium]
MNVSVERSKTEDLLQIVDEVKGYVATAAVPEGYELKTWYDQSVDVRDRMNLLTKNGLQGLALVFIVLAIFLDIRLAFWVALGIPVAVFGACVVLLYGGQTLNMLSMFAFLMALGIVVDDAIVIGENIFEHRSRGENAVRAAIDGTLEVLPSVAASVSTTIIAFMPLLFVSGVMGKFIAVMPAAVIAMLVLSLIESTFILPCHLAHTKTDGNFADAHWGASSWKWFSDKPAIVKWGLGTIVTAIATILTRLAYPFLKLADLFGPVSHWTNTQLGRVVDGIYLPVLKWCIRNPWLVICGAYAMFFASLGLYLGGVTPYTTMPDLDSKLIEAKITYPDGTPEAVTREASARIEKAIRDVTERFVVEQGDSPQYAPEMIRTLRRTVGQVRDAGAIGPEGRATGSHVAKIDVEMVEASERGFHSEDIIAAWRKEAGNFPGAESIIFGVPEFGPGGIPIEFRILGPPERMDEITAVVDQCKQELAKYPGVVDIRDDLTPGKWEYQLKINDRAKSLGITLGELAQTVRSAYYGAEVMRLQRGRHEVKLMVRYPPSERSDKSSFEDIRVRTANGNTYPLTELADVTVSRGYSEINRIDQLRSVAVLADNRESEGNARATVEQMKIDFFPGLMEQYPGLRVYWEGQQQQTNESVSSMFRGMIVAMVAMFVLLTVEFRSYFQPAIILAVIPFGVVGAICGHALMGLNLTLFTIFGLVALTGVVVNDSIVLMDFINLRMQAGDSLADALVNAGRRRFRPVILTSVTTIAGLTPMLMETSFQAQFLIPLAATLVFGLLVATVMVLILIPTFYFVYQRLIHGAVLQPFSSDSPAVDSLANEV